MLSWCMRVGLLVVLGSALALSGCKHTPEPVREPAPVDPTLPMTVPWPVSPNEVR